MAEYLNNKELINEIKLSKEKGELTPRAVQMFVLLVDRVSTKFQYKHPGDREDCKQTALLHVCKYWHKFDETRYNNAFAFYTTLVKNAMALGFNQLYKQNMKIISINDLIGL